MTTSERPVRVVEYEVDVDAAPPSGPELARHAASDGFDRVLVHARTTADGWLVAHVHDALTFEGSRRDIADLTLAETRRADERPASLEATMLAAHRAHVGLVVRLHDTLGIAALTAALGIMQGDDTASLRRRYLVVVADQRTGRRLRSDARQVPSALLLRERGGKLHGALARRFPNLARAAAECDDLIVPASLYSPDRVRDELVPVLTRRAAFVWVAGLDDATEPAYADTGAGGWIVQRRLS